MTFELTDGMLAKWPTEAEAVVRLLSARIAKLEAQVVEVRGKTPKKLLAAAFGEAQVEAVARWPAGT